MTRIVLDEEGLLPIRDADDLHEVDLDTDLWNRLPDLRSGADTH